MKMLVILGPTATGKTDLALYLAKKFNGELVSCDSRQVYIGLDIGTGKISNLKSQMSNVQKGNCFWEIDGVKIWMYDVVDLNKQYSVAEYVKDASRVIGEIKKRGKLPIVAGGTGLYLKALIEGLSFLKTPIDKKLREKLSSFSLIQLQKKLQKSAPKKWEKMNNSDRNNPRRLIRVLEISLASLRGAKRRSNLKKRLPRPFGARNDVLRIGLTAPKEVLYEKINSRVYKWIEDGILGEVINLRKKGISKKRFKGLGLEYSVVAEYIDEKLKFEEMIEKMQTKVRQYAKRQITWFKKEKNIIWFDITKKGYQEKIEKLVSKWYDNLNNDTKNRYIT